MNNGKAGADRESEARNNKKQEWAAFDNWVRGLASDEGGHGHTDSFGAASGSHDCNDDKAE